MFGRRKDDKMQRSGAANAAVRARRNPGDQQRPNAREGYRGQIGLLDVPNMSDMGKMDDGLDDDDDDDDDDLEAELMALQAGLDIRKVISRHRLEAEGMSDDKPKSETEIASDDDQDVDITDPELQAELQGIEKEPEIVSRPRPGLPSVPRRPALPSVALRPELSSVPLRPSPLPPAASVRPPAVVSAAIGPSATINAAPPVSLVDVLRERIEMYRVAQSNAKAADEIAKVRRLDRGLKTLESMLKSAKAGHSIKDEDMPPPVAVGALKPSEVPGETSSMGGVDPEPSEFNSVDVGAYNRTAEPRECPSPAVLQPAAAPPLPPRNRPALSPPSAPMPPPTMTPFPLPPPPFALSMIEQQTQHKARELSLPDQEAMQLLLTRRGEYRKAALAAKRENDRGTTLHYVKIAKLFDAVISAMEAGEKVDLSDMPPSPPTYQNFLAANKLQATVPEADDQDNVVVEDGADDTSVVFNAPPPPTSILDSLEQRLLKYRSATDEAQSSDNASKARRMGRIVKQYEDAIKAYKAGKPINFEELPTPPGFAPIPVNSVQSTPPPPTLPPRPMEPLQQVKVSPGDGQPAASSCRVAPSPPSGPAATGVLSRSVSLQRSPQALHEKQHAALVERQDLFKVAALEAKRRGDIQAAKEYLKLAKGFDPMIKASLCGLPVNMDSVPLPPQKNQEATFELVSHEDCEPVGDRDELFEKLDKELIAQIETCANNRSHFSKIGDVQSKKKFEALLLDTKKDLDFVRHANKGGYPVPRFHYETKTFSIVRCFTDLGDDDVELSVIRGINYACSNPAEVDTYVRFEFPYPETPQKDKTNVVRNTNNPEYNAVFKLSMNRKSRNLTRVIKRQAFKFEIWARGGFLRSDILLGATVVKLAPLETRCAIHDSFDLMEGRKPIGGKLEVQIRIRDPILNKQVETLCEKWLVVSGGHATQL